MNDCLAAFGAAPLADAADLFASSASFLCTTPEFDHYPDRHDSAVDGGPDTFVGTLWVDHVGRPAEWPGGDLAPHRVFAYLRPGLPGLEEVLSALQRSGAAVLVMSPGVAPATMARWQGTRLRFTRELVALRDVARQADLVVCSGSDTLHGLAQSGVPVLGLPLNAEQRIAAERVRDTGAGRWLLPGTDADALLAAMRDLLDDPHYRAAALRLKARHPPRDASARLAPVVAACQTFLGGGRSWPIENK